VVEHFIILAEHPTRKAEQSPARRPGMLVLQLIPTYSQCSEAAATGIDLTGDFTDDPSRSLCEEHP